MIVISSYLFSERRSILHCLTPSISFPSSWFELASNHTASEGIRKMTRVVLLTFELRSPGIDR